VFFHDGFFGISIFDEEEFFIASYCSVIVASDKFDGVDWESIFNWKTFLSKDSA
jgi:hypothetical protein